ncbi:MAG TPA: multiprotein bridging factor aMBF1 [Thermoplasmata archaeon]|jgi:putative transcription factor|nr:multiprotein bridging factor aMBF1 [Thermoplasmata archaeon]
MLCEVCGADVPRTKTVTVEGTVLNACPSCARFGIEVDAPVGPKSRAVPAGIAERLAARKRRMAEKDVYAQSGEEDLAEDYAERIRRARESRGWKQADLGMKINERVTIIAKLESGTIVPNDNLIRRLERALEIKLKEKAPAVALRKAGAPEAMTLGDLMDLDEGE